MDIDRALADLRESVQQALGVVYDASKPECEHTNLLRDIAEAFDNIDETLAKGGFLPEAWSEANWPPIKS